MNYVLFNSDGSVKRTNFTDVINQNSDGVNSIFISIDGLDINTHGVEGVFILPSGVVVGESGTPEANFEYTNGLFADGYVLTLTQAETSLAGIVYLTILVRENGANLFTFRVALTINETASIANLTLINLAQYNALKEYIDTSIENIGDYYVPYTDAHFDLNLGEKNMKAKEVVATTLIVASTLSSIYLAALAIDYAGQIKRYENDTVVATYNLPQESGTLATTDYVQDHATKKQVIGAFNTSSFAKAGGDDFYSLEVPISNYIDEGDLLIITWGGAFVIAPIPSKEAEKGAIIDLESSTNSTTISRGTDNEVIITAEIESDGSEVFNVGNIPYIYSIKADVTLSLDNDPIYQRNLLGQLVDETLTGTRLLFTIRFHTGFYGQLDDVDVENTEIYRAKDREGHVVGTLIDNTYISKIVRVKYEINPPKTSIKISLEASFTPPSNYTGYIVEYKL